MSSQVMDWKERGVPFSSPPPVVWKSPSKVQVQKVSASATPPATSAAEVQVSNSDASENGNNNEGEGLHRTITLLLKLVSTLLVLHNKQEVTIHAVLCTYNLMLVKVTVSLWM